MPASPDHAPIAAPRSSRRKLASSSARLPGVSSAAPTPWIARAAISVSISGAREQSTEATANQATPDTNTRRRPKRSPSEPPISSSPARVSA